MIVNLKGKKAVITGSTSGIGYAIAEALAQAGCSVLINGRTEQSVTKALHKLIKELPEADVSGVAADLSSPQGINKMIECWPETDILVNNIGIFEPKPFFDITDEEWDTYIQVNLMSAVRLSRHYVKEMVKRGWGRVINNASATSGFFSGEMVHYGATKAALLAFSRGLAESVAGSGVTVNAFLPGPTKTEKVESFMTDRAQEAGKSTEQFEQELFEKHLPTSLIKRFATTKEVANLVVFLASEQASAITGTTQRVDGGILRSIL
ncbi:SDR family NAD(P)-dependent oxidoreductase [Aeribacillus pallidus]|uniref:SDR family NAD(P)-dependent oxidoreductase n=1 Tax=Aeribacillus pallidus TaxID=33936 RepID=UPI003D1A6B3F